MKFNSLPSKVTFTALALGWGTLSFSAAFAQQAPNYQDPAFLEAVNAIPEDELAAVLASLGSRVPDELIPISKAEGMFLMPGKVGTIYHFHVGDPASDGILGNAFAYWERGRVYGWHHFGQEPWTRIAGVTAPKADRQNVLMEHRSIVDGVLTVDLTEVEFSQYWAQEVSTLPEVLVDGCGAEPPTNRLAAKVMFGHSGLLKEVVEQACP